MRVLGVILARAGSKGLPGKNVARLHGEPMIAWTIAHAKAAKCLGRIVVSTDGTQIAYEAARRGIAVIERPPALATDTATVDSAARHAVETVEREEGPPYDAVVILYGNVPCRPADLIDRAVEKLAATGCESVQSVCPVGKMHPYWMKKLARPAKELSPSAVPDVLLPYEPNNIYRRQDLPPVYMLDGGIIAVTRQSLFTVAPGEPHAFLGKDRRAVVTQPSEVVDVDTAVDLAYAEHLFTNGDRTPFPEEARPRRMPVIIRGHKIGPDQGVYVIAELGVNHNGSVAKALELTQAAKRAGADAIKLQLFNADLLLSAEAELAEYQKSSASDPREMLQALQLDSNAMAKVRDCAHRLGLGFIVTCFSVELVPVLCGLAVDAVKVASPDLVNTPLLRELLTLSKPMLLSLGASDPADFDTATQCVGDGPVVWMQCVSSYPVPTGMAGLPLLRDHPDADRAFGYSDHTTSIHMGMMAVAAGACVIEKHLTYDRTAPGPDHAASFDPHQFAEYVKLIRIAQQESGPATDMRTVLPCEQDVRRVARQSVCAVHDLPVGHVIMREDVTVKRPGTGIPATQLDSVIGRRMLRPVTANHLIRDADLDLKSRI
jgi:sialic acid synthase SpsE/CMP-N-acetylneuraminic acid synthetase